MPQVTMPQLGEGVEQGTIGKWLKAVGDHVRIGDPIVEVVTDKVNAEVPSPFEGTLTRILVSEGDTVANDVAIAEVEVEGAVVGDDHPAPDEPIAAAGFAAAPPEAATRAAAPEGAAPPSRGNGAAPSGVGIPPGIRMTPAVRRLAREKGVDVTAITGSGAGGRITRDDIVRAATGAVPAAAAASAMPTASTPSTPSTGAVPAAAAASAMPTASTPSTGAVPAPAAASAMPTASTPSAGGSATAATASAMPTTTPSTGASATAATSHPARAGGAAQEDSPVKEGDSLKRLSPMRRAIVAHMTKFLSVPTAYITIEVDMTPVVRRRGAINGEYKAREGISLSYVAFMTKACVEALRKHHDINAHWTEEGHWRRRDINVGIAVAVPDGLVVPVIKRADGLSMHGLNVAINDLAARARDKKLRPEDLEGGTFTVDNTGWTGSILTLPIINVPEVAIITMEKIVKRPVVLEQQGDAIAIRSMMNMCIAIDHRATDGAQAGEFLGDVQRWLESVDDNTPIW